MTIPHRTPAASDGVTTLTARSPEDVLALAPVLMGFWPTESIVMLTFGAERPFHARLDLPPLAEQGGSTLRDVEDALLGPARDHGARRLVLLYLGSDRAAAEGVHRALRRGCRRSGIAVITALYADGRRYYELGHPDPALRAVGRTYDVSHHPFVVRALVEGRIAHRTREEMVASLEAVPSAVELVDHALRESGRADDPPPGDRCAILSAGRWVEDVVARRAGADEAASDEEVALLLLAIRSPWVRDAAWSLIRRPEADAHARFWADVVRRCPDDLVAPAAALLGWAAWQSGDGARAWAAVDRCRRADPGYSLATHLGRLLEHAIPPEEWRGGFDWTRGLPR